MFSYTVMVIDLIDPVDFLYSGQHSQQPCADRSAGKISVTPLGDPKILEIKCASRVPTSACG